MITGALRDVNYIINIIWMDIKSNGMKWYIYVRLTGN